MAKSKWFRVATEGATVDGRVLQREHLEQAAASFDRTVYGARVWLEHYRGLLPGGPFDALGDVLALRAQMDDDKLRLYAQIAPSEQLIKFNKAGQKIYTSIELDPNFANTAKAYVVGLAVTDSPASLGTDALQFSVNAKRPSDYQKHLFSAACETTFEMDDGSGEGGKATDNIVLRALTQALELLSVKPKAVAPLANAVPAAASAPSVDAPAFDFTALQAALRTDAQTISSQLSQLQADLSELQTKFATIDQTPPAAQAHAHRYTGMHATATDC